MGAYVDEADYMALTDGSQPYDGQRILQAEDEVNDLCFGRIAAIGFDRLTDFQRRRVQKAVCLHAVFLAQYADMLQSPLASYGINGVSMSFDSGKTVTQGGVTTSHAVLAQLRQSGLAVRLIP